MRATQVDIGTIGAGGGSIAAIDLAGALLVGPGSAGAVPGPACYGRGGTRATVTDALAVLGTFPPGLLGGDFGLDLDAAATALTASLPSYADPHAAAAAVARVTLHKMAVLIREVTTNRGFDPRTCSLFAFGGAGGAFAVDLARELGMPVAYVPPAASVFSALGAALSQVGYETSQSLLASVADADPAQLAEAVAGVERRAGDALSGEGVPLVELRVAVALKYRSQPHAVDVALPPGDDIMARLGGAVARFHDEHARQYGMRRTDPVDLVAVSATALGPDTGEWSLTAVRLATTGADAGSGRRATGTATAAPARRSRRPARERRQRRATRRPLLRRGCVREHRRAARRDGHHRCARRRHPGGARWQLSSIPQPSPSCAATSRPRRARWASP